MKNSDAARVDINKWVEKNTQGENQHEFNQEKLKKSYSTLLKTNIFEVKSWLFVKVKV